MDFMRFLFINNSIDLSNKIGMILQVESSKNIPFFWPGFVFNTGCKDSENNLQPSTERSDKLQKKVNFLFAKDYILKQDYEKNNFLNSNIRCSYQATNSPNTKKNHIEKYDLIIIDQLMKITDGIEVSEEIRRYEMKYNHGQYIQIVALASFVLEDKILKIWNEGINFHFYETYKSADLLQIINDLNIL